MKKSSKKKMWLWTKRIAIGTAIVAVVRESYLALGPRREARRAIYEQALQRAHTLGVPLVVLGDPDGGLMNHMLGRQWQCGSTPGDKQICIDPAGCGICPVQTQGWPEDALKTLPDNSAVIYDPGSFAMTNDGLALATQMKRVAKDGAIYMADVEPTSLAAFFEFKRKRRVLVAPQTDPASTLVWQPTWWRKEPSSGIGAKQALALRGINYSHQMFGVRGMQHPPITSRY